MEQYSLHFLVRTGGVELFPDFEVFEIFVRKAFGLSEKHSVCPKSGQKHREAHPP
jgi:hypothetical protein